MADLKRTTSVPEYFTAADQELILDDAGISKTFDGIDINAKFVHTAGLFLRFKGLTVSPSLIVTCDGDQINNVVHVILRGDYQTCQDAAL